jgi:hypothetical protein
VQRRASRPTGNGRKPHISGTIVKLKGSFSNSGFVKIVRR